MQHSQLTTKMDADLVGTITELLRSAFQTVIFLIGGVFLIWAVFVFVILFPSPIEGKVLTLTPILILTCSATLWLLPRYLIAAQIIWQTGLMITITVALYLFERPEISFFYALLPLMAMITMNWIIGGLSEGVIVLLMGYLGQGPLAGVLPTSYLALIALGRCDYPRLRLGDYPRPVNRH